MAIAVATLVGAFASSVPARYAELAHPSENVSAALAELGLSASAYALYNVALDTIFVSVFAAVAIVIFWRRSDDPMALLVATMLVVWGPLNGLFVLTPSATEGEYGLVQAASGSVLTYVGYITWMLFFYLFPSGRFVPRWTRWLALIYGVFFFGLWTFTPFGPESWPPPLFIAAVLAVWGSFPMAQIYRYARVSSQTERQQTKWVVFGVAVAIVGTLATMFTIGAAVDLPPRDVGPRMLSMLLMDASALMIPLSIGIAMLRSRLFDIDVVINRTLVYGSLTAMLVALYVGGVAHDPGGLPRPHRTGAAATARGRRLYPRDSRPVQPFEAAHPELYRPTLLPQQVRRRKDSRRLLRPPARGDGPYHPQRRPGLGGQGNDAAAARLVVVAPRHGLQGRRARASTQLRSPYQHPCTFIVALL